MFVSQSVRPAFTSRFFFSSRFFGSAGDRPDSIFSRQKFNWSMGSPRRCGKSLSTKRKAFCIHKSIKYNVWSSTSNGNKKLNATYNEAAGDKSSCPVFLIFSVNTSGQFVGLAEMV
ncbi:hypothetical protein Bca52824_087460 [Brassica carinata]|uniref:YTH domain-containing family protein n=1 Tax=Brassica carinata TaxID=52824 RepID=A0A8X7TN00_BRACI|nr:hypothetical protein Bca52824_087460 [Brassica carinata]